MSNPLKKEREDLTTADIAQDNRPETNEFEIKEGYPRPKLVQSERSPQNQVPVTATAKSEQSDAEAAPLFPNNELQELRTNWDRIQAGFVDEPRKVVEQADTLVASTMKRLAEVFAQERSRLEQQWDRGDNVSTEDLRLALQRYRSFFHRLLAI
jgi:hypothetical protein